MALVRIKDTEYNAKEVFIDNEYIRMILTDNKEEKVELDKNKVISISLSGNIKKCSISGCAMVSGNISDGTVKNTLIIDGYLNEYSNDTSITRLKPQDVDGIRFKNIDKNILGIEIIGTIEMFKTDLEAIVDIHGTVGYIESGKSIKVCGKVHKMKVGEQIIGTLSLIESPSEEQIRKENEQKVLERNKQIIESVQKEFN